MIVPDGWKIEKLFDCLDRIIDYRGKSTPKDDSGVPLITARNVREGYLDFSTQEYMGLDDYETWMTRGLPKSGDLLFTTEAPLGNVALFPDDNVTYALAQRLVTLRADEKVLDSRYLMYYFLSPRGSREVKIRATGSTATGIRQSELRKVPILLPPLPEQRKIAGILGAWDEAITLTERLIQARQRRKKALMQQLLTGKVRFGEFEGEWREVDLGDLATVRRGASPRPIRDPKWFAEEGRGWVRIGDITKSPTRFLEETTQYLSPLGEEKSVKVEVGDLIMSICATIGVPKIINIPACIHDGFVVFSDYEDNLDEEFLYHYLNLLTDRLANRGQPGTQKNLNTSLVRKIKVPNISLAEQRKIASVLTTCEEEINLLQQKLASLRRQKKGLMQQLLTGRVRVKVKDEG